MGNNCYSSFLKTYLYALNKKIFNVISICRDKGKIHYYLQGKILSKYNANTKYQKASKANMKKVAIIIYESPDGSGKVTPFML